MGEFSSTELATWVVDEVLRLGVERVVLAPGSRSAPLAFAFAARADRGDVTLHTRIDERTASFLALGMAKGSRRPAAVVTTSGTAVANLHPAMLEAAHAGVPLLAITADRPASLRGTGANQTTDQIRMFGDAADFLDLSATTIEPLTWDRHGPFQLNVQFAEPLVPPPSNVEPSPVTAEPSPVTAEPSPMALELSTGAKTVVVAGDDSGRVGRQIAEAGGWPLLAEPSSGSRTGSNALRTYRLLLQTGLGSEVERVIVTGHPTLSRPVSRLMSRSDVEVISVRAQGRWPDRPFAIACEADGITVVGEPDLTWLNRWRQADRELGGRIDHYVAMIPDLSPYDVAAEVAAATPPDGLLWIGASNPIRDLDIMAAPTPVGERRMVLANRGLAGIDGTLSSAIGAALARRPSRAIAYVGDVTFLHDITALVQGADEPRPDLTIVVANDNGGSIFSTLEQGAPEYASSFERLFATPHGVNIEALAAAMRIPHWRVTSRVELAHALANAHGGLEIVEATIARNDRRRWESELRSLAQ